MDYRVHYRPPNTPPHHHELQNPNPNHVQLPIRKSI